MRPSANGADAQHFSSLHRLLDEVFSTPTAESLSDVELAELAGLHHTTVYRRRHRLIDYPALKTVWKLGRAVGLQIRSEEL